MPVVAATMRAVIESTDTANLVLVRSGTMHSLPCEDWNHINRVSGRIVGSSLRVHTALGPGLLESAYRACLAYELRKQGVAVAEEVALPVVYDAHRLEVGYRVDILVEDLIVVEIKSVAAIAPIHKAQLISYLKLSGKPLGLLLNFNVVRMKDGIVRMRNG